MNMAAHALSRAAIAAGEIGMPRLRAISTAVPEHAATQEMIRDHVREFLSTRTNIFDTLAPVFANARIDTRYLCQPIEWYLADHDFGEKMKRFSDHAVALGLEVASDCLATAGLQAREIDAIVSVSSTGILTPSLDARLMNVLPFRRDTIRCPIFGLGCAGGVLGMTRAAQIARSRPGMRVLLLVVELCGLAFRRDRWEPRNVVATALFGDGAPGLIIENPVDADDGVKVLGTIGPAGEHGWQDTLEIMGWNVDANGFDVIFHRSIPSLVSREYPLALAAFLARNDLTIDDITRMCCHPGGVKVIKALEDAAALDPGSLDVERQVLRDYGNMSAPTVLFVLERLIRKGQPGRVLLSALGPGFCAAFQTITITPLQ